MATENLSSLLFKLYLEVNYLSFTDCCLHHEPTHHADDFLSSSAQRPSRPARLEIPGLQPEQTRIRQVWHQHMK
jgi:hypothetical protein